MKKYSKTLTVVVLILVAVTGAAYGMLYGETQTEKISGQETPSAPSGEVVSAEIQPDVETGQTQVRLEKDRAVVTGTGASISGTTVTISQAGTYSISGILEKGQIYVDAGDDDIVVLSLNGVDISNPSDTAIHVENAGQTILFLERGTDNRVMSGTQSEWSPVEDGTDDNVSGGAIYARDDLSITGDGALQVFGYINNGIQTANHLVIDSGNIEVTALNLTILQARAMG